MVGHPSHPNASSPADQGRAEDTGTFFRFEFVPEYGEQYCLSLEIYNGFSRGARDVHFHLGEHSYYRNMTYVLDLSRFLDAGHVIEVPPQLFLDPKDAGHSQICAQRAAREPVPWSSDRPGVYRWQFKNLRQGVIDILWDVVNPSESVAEPRSS